jgi:hypothetical protein
VLTPGLGATRRTLGLHVYDPGPRAATVTISSPVGGEPPIEITEEVPAGEVRAVVLPSPAAPVRKSPEIAGARQHQAQPPAEGPIVVRTAEGVGVVVSRIAVLVVGHHEVTVAFTDVTSMPANDWVVPATASGASVAGGIVISNSGLQQVEVELIGLTARGGAASITQLSTLTVPPSASAAASIHLPASGGSYSGVLVIASARVVVEQDLYGLGTLHEIVPVAPLPVEGVPVTG